MKVSRWVVVLLISLSVALALMLLMRKSFANYTARTHDYFGLRLVFSDEFSRDVALSQTVDVVSLGQLISIDAQDLAEILKEGEVNPRPVITKGYGIGVLLNAESRVVGIVRLDFLNSGIEIHDSHGSAFYRNKRNSSIVDFIHQVKNKLVDLRTNRPARNADGPSLDTHGTDAALTSDGR